MPLDKLHIDGDGFLRAFSGHLALRCLFSTRGSRFQHRGIGTVFPVGRVWRGEAGIFHKKLAISVKITSALPDAAVSYTGDIQNTVLANQPETQLAIVTVLPAELSLVFRETATEMRKVSESERSTIRLVDIGTRIGNSAHLKVGLDFRRWRDQPLLDQCLVNSFGVLESTVCFTHGVVNSVVVGKCLGAEEEKSDGLLEHVLELLLEVADERGRDRIL